MAEAAPYLHCWFAKLCTSKYYGAWSGRNLARTVHFILLYSTEIPGPSVFSLNVFSSWMLSSFCHIILHSRNLASGLCHVKGRPPCSCSKTSIMHFLTFSIPHQPRPIFKIYNGDSCVGVQLSRRRNVSCWWGLYVFLKSFGHLSVLLQKVDNDLSSHMKKELLATYYPNTMDLYSKRKKSLLKITSILEELLY